jgi:hypothetical protein
MDIKFCVSVLYNLSLNPSPNGEGLKIAYLSYPLLSWEKGERGMR